MAAAYIKSYWVRHALSVALAVFIAVMLNHYVAWSQTGWMILTAFLSAQTTRGTPLRQSVIVSVIMIVAIVIAFFINMYASGLIAVCIAGTVFMVSNYIVYINQPIQNKTVFRIMLLAFVLLIALVMPMNFAQLQNQMIDILIGAGIGVVCGQLILRVRLDKEFKQGLIPVLQSLLQFSRRVTDYFLRHENDATKILKVKLELETSLEVEYGLYPEWVYEIGFNPGLRSGFRFYLVSIERMVELFLSMDYLAARGVEADLIIKMADFIDAAMQKNAELISILIEYFEKNKLKDVTADFTSDIAELEKAAQRFIPGHLELLDISQDYITLTAFIRNIKDLRRLLLQLVMALPNSK